MPKKLEGKKVAILVADGFEEIELTSPKKALDKNGATTHIISPNPKRVRAWSRGDWSDDYEVDRELSGAHHEEYHALLLPGGVLNPDKLRRDRKAIEFARAFMAAGKPVAAICHGPQLLIETGTLRGREMTSFPAISTDLQNAGARWIDNEVIVDQGLITSRSPADLEAFNNSMIEEFAMEIYAPEESTVRQEQ